MAKKAKSQGELATGYGGNIRWFSATGAVTWREDGCCDVHVGGMLIGAFRREDPSRRNVLVVMLSKDPTTHLGDLAKAFGLSPERLRQLRRKYEEGGVRALVTPSRNGRPPKVTPKQRERLEAMFERGITIAEARKKVRGLAYSTVGHVHTAWAKRMDKERLDQESKERAAEATLSLPGIKRMAPRPRLPEVDAASTDVRSHAFVQHAGTWLMIAMLAKLGLHETAERFSGGRVAAVPLRVAIDAAAIALTLGQSCVEGVRRIATPTASVLLRATHCPSPSAVRGTIKKLAADFGAVAIPLTMLSTYVARAKDVDGVFYIDNHLRPYSGARVVRRGWRMQDKRVKPGITDYYVHDEDGRPLFRIDVPSHDSLTKWLGPITSLLRKAVGNDERVLVAFDRAGSFPEAMAQLRDEGFEFVTYERRPFPALADTAFTERAILGDEVVHFTEARTNLGRRRGRVRRISIREQDGRQINLLAASDLPAERLIEIMRGRWRQENGFKHGVERWGINQLDRRRTTAYPPDTIVPNPARRRLDRALRAACIRDGDARRMLAELGPDHPRRVRAQRDLDEAIALRRKFESERVRTPSHARLSETELRGKLVRHDGAVKNVIDSIRIACANIETELAEALAPHLPKPPEAKKTLASLFAAPGRIRVGLRTISVELAPAATRPERHAFGHLFEYVNRLALSLPGDPRTRRIRFRSQIQREA